MSIKLNEVTMVCPTEETPKQCLWLSRLDMMIRQPYSHTHSLLIYHRNSEIESISTFFDAEILKDALSKALVLYYPLAGRLKINENNGRYEIDCNKKGVLYVDAETKYTLSDLNDGLKSNHKLRKELIPICDYSKGLSSFPLFLVQVTRFKCGGVTLGFASHHHVMDAFSHVQFVHCWANLANGLEPMVRPCHDRAAFLGPRSPPQVNFNHLEYEPPLSPLPPKSSSGETSTTTECFLKLSEDDINALKVQAIMPTEEVLSKTPSTFKLIAAHVWRSACKARGLADDQNVKLYIHTDGRYRLQDPSLPEGYFGNAIFFSCCIAKAGDLVHNPLWYTISKIDEAVKKMDSSEYLRSSIDYLESQPDLTPLVRGPHTVTCPNLFINSWTRLPISDTDFGWGGPKSTGQGEIKSEGQCTISSSLNNDKSLSVGIRLFTSHSDLFRDYFIKTIYSKVRRSLM